MLFGDLISVNRLFLLSRPDVFVLHLPTTRHILLCITVTSYTSVSVSERGQDK